MRPLATILFLALASSVWAGPPVVESVTVTATDRGFRFDVTIRHGDEGWDHYADGWGVYDLDGTELGYRTLHHPHVTEQPFTRSLTVKIPENTARVIIRPRDSVHALGQDFEVKLP